MKRIVVGVCVFVYLGIKIFEPLLRTWTSNQ
jgi:hypothetical protein